MMPLNREWFYATTLHPYKEGAERINQTFTGYDDLAMRVLSLRERVTRLALGILLMTPLINTIIWFGMHAISQPEYLTDPYIPEECP